MVANDNLSMVKITFMAPVWMAEAARKFAREQDRDLSSVCRMGLRELLKLGGTVTATRGRPSKRKGIQVVL